MVFLGTTKTRCSPSPAFCSALVSSRRNAQNAFQAQVCTQVHCSGISGPGMHTSSMFRYFRPMYVVCTVYRHRSLMFTYCRSMCRHFGPMKSIQGHLQASQAQIKATRPIDRHFRPLQQPSKTHVQASQAQLQAYKTHMQAFQALISASKAHIYRLFRPKPSTSMLRLRIMQLGLLQRSVALGQNCTVYSTHNYSQHLYQGLCLLYLHSCTLPYFNNIYLHPSQCKKPFSR